MEGGKRLMKRHSPTILSRVLYGRLQRCPGGSFQTGREATRATVAEPIESTSDDQERRLTGTCRPLLSSYARQEVSPAYMYSEPTFENLQVR